MTTVVASRRATGAFALRRTCVVVWLLFGLTIIASVIAAHDPGWWRLSLCALGATFSPVARFFDTGLLATAGALAILAFESWGVLRDPAYGCLVTPKQATAVAGSAIALSACLVVVALVPYNVSPTAKLIHNTAGWGSGWLIVACMAFAPALFPFLGRRFLRVTLVCIVVLLSLYAGFETQMLTYAQGQICALGVAAFWTTLFFTNLDRVMSRQQTDGVAATAHELTGVG